MEHLEKCRLLQDMGGTERLTLKAAEHPLWNGNMNVEVFLTQTGERVGYFHIECYRPGLLNIHIGLYPRYKGQGLGREIYDFIGRFAEKIGLQFMPSETLTDDSARIWQARGFPLHLMSEEFQEEWKEKWAGSERVMVRNGGVEPIREMSNPSIP